MKRQIVPIVIISLLMGFCTRSAHNNKNAENSEVTENTSEKNQAQEMKRSFAGPPTIIYKTKKDYSKHVSVKLSEDKEKVVSYPGIKDLYFKGEFAYPTELAEGFLLDNRGIDQNVAFLRLTYEEYSQLEETPSTDELKEMILDDDPITEMYNCGSKHQFKDLENELNDIIQNDQLDSCRKLK